MRTTTREQKEKLFISKETELQRWWGNPIGIDEDWDFVSEWTDEELVERISNAIGQLRFEKVIYAIWTTVKTLVITFILLGILGLLVFGIKQLI